MRTKNLPKSKNIILDTQRVNRKGKSDGLGPQSSLKKDRSRAYEGRKKISDSFIRQVSKKNKKYN